MHSAGAEIGEAFHERIDLMEGFVSRQLIDELEDRAFCSRDDKRPIPRTPPSQAERSGQRLYPPTSLSVPIVVVIRSLPMRSKGTNVVAIVPRLYQSLF